MITALSHPNKERRNVSCEGWITQKQEAHERGEGVSHLGSLQQNHPTPRRKGWRDERMHGDDGGEECRKEEEEERRGQKETKEKKTILWLVQF